MHVVLQITTRCQNLPTNAGVRWAAKLSRHKQNQPTHRRASTRL